MSANDTQVGGNHYKKSNFQPWDWDRYGVGCYECNVIKYVTRYVDKDGLKDLQKALHYVEKLTEEYLFHDRENRCRYKATDGRLRRLINRYNAEFQLKGAQMLVVRYMTSWSTDAELEAAYAKIQDLINAYTISDVQPPERVESPTSF